jgi:hypothetical protein
MVFVVGSVRIDGVVGGVRIEGGWCLLLKV